MKSITCAIVVIVAALSGCAAQTGPYVQAAAHPAHPESGQGMVNPVLRAGDIELPPAVEAAPASGHGHHHGH